MRASRLLRILLLLQNRGRLTAGRLAAELEVAPRTILRDIDALTEAGLPVVTYPGQGGGIALAFDYRTRLTGLDAEEAEAMGVLLSAFMAELDALGLGDAGRRAAAKIWEAFPEQTRAAMGNARARFRPAPPTPVDPRRPAVALAVREGRVVRLRCRDPSPRRVHPSALVFGAGGWSLVDALGGCAIPEADWGDVNISAERFTRGAPEDE